MGNCCKKDSSLEFGGEDWSSATSHEENLHDYGSSIKGEEKGFISKESEKTSNVSELKIKISKKELEELVKRANLEGLSIQEVLFQLMDVGDKYEAQQQKSWRPALKSIPETEVN